ncbi:MAG: glycoside hydrolase family protein [Nitrospinae bacterium]|nr:glycoside hydrolase family protein [Nitrospinota bacterium]
MREITMFVAAVLVCGVLLLISSVSWACDTKEPLDHRLMRHEGVRTCAYDDHLGHLTIGIGHLLQRNEHHEEMCWSPEKVRHVFDMDVERARHNAQYDVSARTWDRLSQTRRDVLTELAFQVGGYGLSLFHRMLAAIQEGNFKLAARNLLKSRLAMQTPSRAHELACLLEHGD